MTLRSQVISHLGKMPPPPVCLFFFFFGFCSAKPHAIECVAHSQLRVCPVVLASYPYSGLFLSRLKLHICTSGGATETDPVATGADG